jgi:excisionase family DNA binding protein
VSQVSISEAATLVGRDRKTLYRAIKEGRLSATQTATGARQVDIAELARVFGVFPVARDSGATGPMPQDATPTATTETGDLKAKIAALEAENVQLRERVADKDRHIEDFRNTVRLLEHQTHKKSRWWPWSKG